MTAPSLRDVVARPALFLACALLSGCGTLDSPPVVSVSSPPPPRFGSAPIMAHDEYAGALLLPSRAGKVMAQAAAP